MAHCCLCVDDIVIIPPFTVSRSLSPIHSQVHEAGTCDFANFAVLPMIHLFPSRLLRSEIVVKTDAIPSPKPPGPSDWEESLSVVSTWAESLFLNLGIFAISCLCFERRLTSGLPPTSRNGLFRSPIRSLMMLLIPSDLRATNA